MKRFITARLITLILVSFWIPASQGQFFKKLKKTVKELVVTPPEGSKSTASGSMSASNTHSNQTIQGKRSATAEDPNLVILRDHASHGIDQICTITVDGKNQYIFMDYTSIGLQNNQITAQIPIGTFTKSEALSELGEGSEKDQVQLYNNGVIAKAYTAAELKNELSLLAEHKRYDYPWGQELVRNAKKEADDYVKKSVGSRGMGSLIQFKGKKYGPYLLIGDLLVSKDRGRFFAQISPNIKSAEKGVYYILGMDGKTRSLPTGGDLIANLDFSSGAVVIRTAAITLNAALHNNDESGTGAKLTSQGTAEAQTAPNKGNVYFLNGNTLENVLLSNGWLDQSGQNFFSSTIEPDSGFDKGTYLNGKKICDQAVQISRGWTNPSGTAWALEGDNFTKDGRIQLIFSDGTRIYEARDVHQLVVDGKYYIVWYNYNHKYSDQLTVYKKAL